ncbi:hypothetical protein DFH07DRAFT_184093 [Mycena maculata]|uniref:DUF6533 domain-containing protein n=1 Tax=Mycena maculata TaxID=230809 RepID=A0AAD7HXC2_9AGAR|nr:hypothetical protein DFH07DRAFT_184093 [Mycena maculata]
MGSMSAVLEARLIPSTLCACATILIYDVMCTLDQEILYVWPRPWSISTVLFVLNRYLPFVDIFVGLSASFKRMTLEECSLQNAATAWLFVMGIMLSEGILMLRTYAIWERKPIIFLVLSILALGVLGPTLVLVHLEIASLEYIPNDGVGCLLSSSSSIVVFGYMMIMVSETGIAVLTAVKAYRDLRRSRVPWVLKLYQDGLLFYLYLLMISVANTVVPLTAPPVFMEWLAMPQRVLHSVLCTRVLLLIHRRRRIVDSEAPRPASEPNGSGVVFSSVIDDNRGDESEVGLTTFEARLSE